MTLAGRAFARIDWFAVTAVAAVGVFLKPSLHAGFRADDTWTSVHRGATDLSGSSLASTLVDTADVFLNAGGRPNVLGPIQGVATSWLISDHRLLYHALLVAATMGSAYVLYLLVRELGVSRAGAALAVVLLAGALQLRSYHDPILGYWGTTQLLTACFLGSLLLFARALRLGDRRLWWWSFALYLPCPLLYESAYTLVGAHLALALCLSRGRAAWRAAAPFLAVGAAFVLLSVYARSAASGTVPQGYEVGGGLWETLRVFVIQQFAPIPGSNLFFRADHASFLPLGTDPTKPELLGGLWRGAFVTAIVAFAGVRLASRPQLLPAAATLRTLAAVGAALWVTSVVVISASPKYQVEIMAGKGHLTTLIQSMGWALLALAAVMGGLRLAAGRSRTAVAVTAASCGLLLGAGAAASGYNNLRVVALERPIVETRALLQDAAGAGVFDALPAESSVVFSERDLRWPTGNWTQVPDSFEHFLLLHADRRLDGRIHPIPERFDCPRTGAFPPQDCEPLAPAAAVVRVRARRDGGTVVVGRLTSSAGAQPLGGRLASLRAYVTDDDGPAPPALVGALGPARPWDPAGLDWRRVTAEGDWAIYEADLPDGRRAPIAGSLDAADGVIDFTQPGEPGLIVRKYGTQHLLP